MGIFSGKTRYHHRVSQSNLIDPEYHQDYIKNAILRGTLGNQGVAPSLVSESINGLASKFRKYYKRGEESELIGLPQGSVGGGPINNAAIKTALDQMEGESCTIEEAQFTTLNAEMYAFDYIDEFYGFDVITLKFQRPPNHLPSDAEVYFKRAYFTFNGLGEHQVVFDYEHRATNGTVIATYSKTATDDSINKDAMYLYVIYTIDSEPSGDLHFWLYNSELGLYPGINYKSLHDKSPYFPVIPIRKDAENIQEFLTETELEEVQRIIKPIGFDLDMMVDQIVNGEGNKPEDMEEVFFTVAMDLVENDKYGKEYLQEYFKDIAAKAESDRVTYEAWSNSNRKEPPPLNIIEISDGEFRNTYSYNFIEIETFTGIAGGPKPGDRRVSCIKGDEVGRSLSVLEFLKEAGDDPISLISTTDDFYLYTQLTDNTFERIWVQGLTCYHIVRGDASEGIVKQRVWDAFDPDAEDGADSFIIPVAKHVVEKLNRLKQNYVYQQSACIIVYAIIKQKVKWYERGFISWLITIIMVVIAWFTGQWYLVGTYGALATIIINVVIQIVIQMAIRAILTKLIDILGIDKFGILAAIVYIVALMYGVNLIDLVAETWVEMANLAMQTYQLIYMDDLAYEMEQWKDFTKRAEEVKEEIEEAEEFLSNETIDMYTILKNQIYFDPNETPTDFYIRTVHDGNPGVKAFDMIHSYHDIQLLLPKNNDFKPKTL